jgi:hypothetical protein
MKHIYVIQYKDYIYIIVINKKTNFINSRLSFYFLTFRRICTSMAVISRLMIFSNSNNVCGLLVNTIDSIKPRKKNLSGVKSGECGDQVISSLLEITRFGNIFSKNK